MSSEAAYFPDSLASAPDTLGPGHPAHDAFPDIVDEAQTIGNETEEQPAACVFQTPELSDSLLLNRVAQGDKEALSVLFRRHAHVVFSVACRILRDESEAEDLVQELFLFFFQKAGLFDAGKSSGASWIIQMAYQRAIDRRRYLDVRHHYSVQEFDEERSAATRGQISIDQIAGRTLLDRFRKEISTEQRQTLELHLFEGYSFREIAAKTGQTFGNIRNHYYRGLERLRSYVFPKE
jgi:RNA polymerase sigma-70 factor (ECF subfamily)